jgi:hypothetical protein
MTNFMISPPFVFLAALSQVADISNTCFDVASPLNSQTKIWIVCMSGAEKAGAAIIRKRETSIDLVIFFICCTPPVDVW